VSFPVARDREASAGIAPIFIGSEIYRGSSYGPSHPLRVPRVSTVMDLCRALGWFAPGQYRTSPQAKASALGLWHDPDYVHALQLAEALNRANAPLPRDYPERFGLGTPSNPAFPEMFRRPATGAGGVMLAAELLRDGGVIHAPGGGTHHGLKARANGFCYLNDVVLGMLVLRRVGVQRIVYLDIDAHHCDGVEAAFAGDDDTRLISVHEERRWPFTGRLQDDAGGNAFNLPVPAGFNDSEMELVLDQLILPRIREFRPDAIILQCGADALTEDPLSRLCLSNNAHRAILAAIRPLSPRLLVLGGGGYNPWSVARLWTAIWGDLAGHALPDTLPPKAGNVLRGLSWGRGGRAAPDAVMMTTLGDAPRNGPVRAEIRVAMNQLARR
jgi:acetoin utilization protein AcuC